MSKVLVTGGTGTLGRLLVPRLAADVPVRVLSRKEIESTAPNVRYVRGDLINGNGLMEATHAVDVIVHCASSAYRKTWSTDVEGTRRLLEAARNSRRAPHIVYVSIVGVDKHPMKYYRAKRAAEGLIEVSGLPYSILRTTQWYELVAYILDRTTKWGVTFVPKGFSFQPLAVTEVATRVARIAGSKPAGMLPDMGGPEVRTIDDLARAWARVTQRDLRLARVPAPGRVGKAFREGLHLAPERAVGRTTWESWLTKNLAPAEPHETQPPRSRLT